MAVVAAAEYPAFQNAAVESFIAALEKAGDEEALAKAVQDFGVEADEEAQDVGGNVMLSGGVLSSIPEYFGFCTAFPGKRWVGGTRLDVTLWGGVLKGTTAGKKKFVGKNAATAAAAGTGYLDKSSSTIYTATTKYEFKPTQVLTYIYFYDASNKKLGTWSGRLLPSVTKAFSGSGAWTA